MCQVEELFDLLHIPPNTRSEADVAKIVDLTSELSFFKRLSLVVRTECCKSMDVKEVRGDESIFEMGDPSDAFYIILKGSVSVLVLKKDYSKGSKNTGVEYLKETILNAGASFGELGLLKNITRTATVTSRETSVLAVLTKTEFDHIISGIENTRLSQIVDYLQSIPIFHSWTKTALSKASYSFARKIYRQDEWVFREKTPANFVYCILEGEFKLSKSIVSNERKMNVSCLYGPRSQTSLNENFRKTLNFKRVKSVKRLRIVVKTAGEVLGESEVVESGTYETSCQCYSWRGVLLAIDKNEFMRFVSNPVSMRTLQERSELNKSRNASRVNLLLELDKGISNPKPQAQATLKQSKSFEELLELPRSPTQSSLASPSNSLKSTPVKLSLHSPSSLSARSAVFSTALTATSFTPRATTATRPRTARLTEREEKTEPGEESDRYASPSSMFERPKATINARFDRLRVSNQKNVKVPTRLSIKQMKPTHKSKCLSPKLGSRLAVPSIGFSKFQGL
eukprot:CAMPEP_0204902690 /NCGR_PEP_ID=MMETSP1397-20131031/3817_1 /ASSEMBLY_ACC=CAM_ASM_000891 /TAXON_ID=49980 /ORGANISM="Climacostomum Climacostomum virens, Strain Stock W-24" /LENGTH=510 /DNA_ID=CAMNT_0052071227 /DNA_START=205 /DNA_END=1737 /DNA_ORIENTATION=-